LQPNEVSSAKLNYLVFRAALQMPLSGVLQFTYLEPVETYMHTDVDNFIFILKTTLDYFDAHDFIYYSKAKNLKIYNEQKNSYLNLIDNLEANRIKYTELWQQERETKEKNIEELKIEWQKIRDNEAEEAKPK